MKSIIDNIRAIRNKKGYSQEYMAMKMGVTQSAYSNWENESRELTYNNLLKIADVFELPVIDIITYPEIFIPKSDAPFLLDEDMVLDIRVRGKLKESITELLLNDKDINKQLRKKK